MAGNAREGLPMTAPSTQEKAEQEAPVIGLALSGGGFRAAAFHLGVGRNLGISAAVRAPARAY
jgi:hypothetical protein